MKLTLTRFWFYLFTTIVISGPFRPSWPDAAVTDTLPAKFAFYFVSYGIGWIFWALLFLAVHEVFSFLRRRKVG